jgi:hypothetical protein
MSVTVSQGLGGPYRSTSMHGTTYMHLAPLTVTDEQLQPLRSNQQQLCQSLARLESLYQVVASVIGLC